MRRWAGGLGGTPHSPLRAQGDNSALAPQTKKERPCRSLCLRCLAELNRSNWFCRPVPNLPAQAPWTANIHLFFQLPTLLVHPPQKHYISAKMKSADMPQGVLCKGRVGFIGRNEGVKPDDPRQRCSCKGCHGFILAEVGNGTNTSGARASPLRRRATYLTLE